jgi:hypothetical protein
MNCAIIVQDDKYDLFTRQSAGTVASRLLNMKVFFSTKKEHEQGNVLLGRNCLTAEINDKKKSS